MNTFADFHIDIGTGSGEEVAAKCPQCGPTRKKGNLKSLSVNTVKGVWVCHHCDWRGTLKSGQDQPGRKLYVRPVWHPEKPSDALYRWFAARGIGRPVVDRAGIVQVEQYLAQLEDRVPCIAFPYVKRGDVVNVKYRALAEKAFQQVSGAEKILFRQDQIDSKQVVLVEGELDQLSCEEAGLTSVVSVPDGAPAVKTKNYAAKFTYLDQTPDPFEGVEKIVLAVDSDEPGQVLQRELGRRLGTDRCWFVTWPAGIKDANELLVRDGPEAIAQAIAQAKPFPVQDAIEPVDLAERIMDRYLHGPARGVSTGWRSVDPFYTVGAGELTVVTGAPGSGKSEWLDALMLNLAEDQGWPFVVCSPENAPVEQHCEKLIEKVVGQPFRPGPHARMTTRMLIEGLDWIQQYVTFVMPTEALTIHELLARATVLVRRKGIRGLIIDPFNEFDHTRPRGQSETEYIGIVLGDLKRWARKWGVNVWLVAHPQKLYRREDGTYPVPTPWDICGSSHFRNKADNCLTVWRDEATPETPVQLHVQKIRFKHIGILGMAELTWDRVTGRFHSATPRVPA